MEAPARTLRVEILSRYPTSGGTAGQRGLATYTQMLAEPLSRRVQLTVLAEVSTAPSTATRPGGDAVSVRRIWTEGPMGLLPVLRDILRGGTRPDVVHVQHEFLAYDSLASNAVLLPLLFLCKLRGISTVVTFHGLLTARNLEMLQVGEYGYRIAPAQLRRMMRVWIRIVAALSDAIVVHEAWQRDTLLHEYGLASALVHRIPHGVPDETGAARGEDRPAHPKPRVLFFGYLAPYKGLEVLLDAVGGIGGPEFELLIAGDASPRARGQPGYEKYLRRIDELIAATHGRARRIGFVPEEEVGPLLRSVDLVVLPYTAVLSSSGPLALAMAYGTPVLATHELFEEGTLSVYDGTVADLRRKLERFVSDPDLRRQAVAELAAFRTDRIWPRIADLHADLYRVLRMGRATVP